MYTHDRFVCSLYVFAAFGYITVAYSIFSIVKTILLFSKPSKLSRYLCSSHSRSTVSILDSEQQPPESWALVTGSSDGLGLGLADELAAFGFNVFLHGRNLQKLSGVKERLSRKHPHRHFRILVADVSHPDMDIQIKDLTNQLDQHRHESEKLGQPIRLNVLVNNIGGHGGMRVWRSMFERTQDEIDALVDINLRFPVQITKALLPTLERNSPGLIINIGSIVADLPLAYNVVYGSSKAFNMAWSRGLKLELESRNSGIEVLGIRVGQVATASAGSEQPEGFFTPNPNRMARSILNRVGCGRAIVNAHWTHALQLPMIGLMPEWLKGKSFLDAALPKMIAEKAKYGDGVDTAGVSKGVREGSSS